MTPDRSSIRTLGLCLVILALLPVVALAQPDETIYLELWKPGAEDAEAEPEAPEREPQAGAPEMLFVVGRPTVSAPIAQWCEGLRARGGATLLPEALLRGASYERFATESVPLRLEVLIDDVEMRYALGTERPEGVSGTSFPFFELCAVGFGSRVREQWALDVLHVMNHRGDSMALGLYKGALGAAERAYLENQLGYSTALPDPAGLLLIGDAEEIDTLLLVESPSSVAFDALRRRIVR